MLPFFGCKTTSLGEIKLSFIGLASWVQYHSIRPESNKETLNKYLNPKNGWQAAKSGQWVEWKQWVQTLEGLPFLSFMSSPLLSLTACISLMSWEVEVALSSFNCISSPLIYIYIWCPWSGSQSLYVFI